MTSNAARAATIRLLFALALLAAVAAPAFAAGPHRDAVPARMLLGYYVGYERDLMPPDEIEWDALTHIAVGTALPTKKGGLDLRFDLGPGEGPAFAKDLAQRAHANAVVPILMVGGAGAHDAFRGATESAKTRKRFVQTLVATVGDLGFDGIDLDWEPMNSADEKPFKALVFDLRRALPNAVLTVPADPTTLTFPDVPAVFAQVAPQLDRINVMTYGMEGAFAGWQSWHSSALDGATSTTPSSVAATVSDFLAAGIPAAKLGVGVGFFGDCWSSPVNGPKQDLRGARIVATDSDMSLTTILADYLQPGAARVDPLAKVPYLGFDAPHGAKNCTYVTYEDATSIAAKGAWARDHGLGGAIVWTINQGHDRGAPAGQRDAILREARQAFGA